LLQGKIVIVEVRITRAEGLVAVNAAGLFSTILKSHHDAYVVVFSHHPSYRMANVAPDPRDPGEHRHDGVKSCPCCMSIPT